MNRNEFLTRQALPPKDASRRRAAILAAHPPPRDGRMSSGSFDDRGNGGAAIAVKADRGVGLGSTVQILDLRTQERQEYTLVSPCNADFWLNRISSLTPLGRALFGRHVGEIVEVDAPAGAFAIQIERIDHEA